MRRKSFSRLSKKQHYLQVAMNSTLTDARAIIAMLPSSDRIIIEAGTPLIKRYGIGVIRELHALTMAKIWGTQAVTAVGTLAQQFSSIGVLGASRGQPLASQTENSLHAPYIVADMKTIDRGETEVAMCAEAGASAVIAMGSAPTETLSAFIAACEAYGVDAMIDMMNVEYPLAVLSALKRQPRVVILHRGVDEERDNKQKMLPLHEIRRIKGAHDTLIAVAGGDTPREMQSAFFNDADIVVIWKSVYQQGSATPEMIDTFLKEIK